MPVTLYKRQREIFEYICQYINKFGHSPTLKEIATAMQLSSLATVHEHLMALEKKHVLRRYEGAVRGIEITFEGISFEDEEPAFQNVDLGISIPMVGYIAAGRPIDAIEDRSSSITIPFDMVSGVKRTYVLQVKGDSMIEAGILDGDFVIIEQANTANNGDIVVALIDNQVATLKRFFKMTGGVYKLEPANSTMDPIFVKDLQIQGTVKGVLRKY